MKTGFYIEGARQLQRNLDTLGKRVQKKVIRQAVRAGQKPLLNRAKSNAQSRVGGSMGAMLVKNIVIRAPRRQKAGRYALHVQLRPGVTGFRHITEDGKEHFIPAAIEFGHGADKESAARPYMRPAADSTRAETVRILTKQLRVGILREAIRGRYA